MELGIFVKFDLLNEQRTLLQSKEFESFKANNPQLEVVVQDRKQRHPFVEGTYGNSN